MVFPKVSGLEEKKREEHGFQEGAVRNKDIFEGMARPAWTKNYPMMEQELVSKEVKKLKRPTRRIIVRDRNEQKYELGLELREVSCYDEDFEQTEHLATITEYRPDNCLRVFDMVPFNHFKAKQTQPSSLTAMPTSHSDNGALFEDFDCPLFRLIKCTPNNDLTLLDKWFSEQVKITSSLYYGPDDANCREMLLGANLSNLCDVCNRPLLLKYKNKESLMVHERMIIPHDLQILLPPSYKNCSCLTLRMCVDAGDEKSCWMTAKEVSSLLQSTFDQLAQSNNTGQSEVEEIAKNRENSAVEESCDIASETYDEMNDSNNASGGASGKTEQIPQLGIMPLPKYGGEGVHWNDCERGSVMGCRSCEGSRIRNLNLDGPRRAIECVGALKNDLAHIEGTKSWTPDFDKLNKRQLGVYNFFHDKFGANWLDEMVFRCRSMYYKLFASYNPTTSPNLKEYHTCDNCLQCNCAEMSSFASQYSAAGTKATHPVYGKEPPKMPQSYRLLGL